MTATEKTTTEKTTTEKTTTEKKDTDKNDTGENETGRTAPAATQESPPLGVTPEQWAEFNDQNAMTALRRYAQKYWPYERLLPSHEPIYVTRMFYLFGSLALMSLVSLIITGVILVFKGPLWWHSSGAGNFFNALHFWSVQVFFFAIFVHLGSSFFTAAWRGGRGLTWVFGALTFFVAILTGLTGYVAQTNFDGQYIGQQAKDAMNAVGLGYVLNLMNLDNLIGWHVVILPLGVVGCLALHLLWVRRHGVVAPFPAEGTSWQGEQEPAGPTPLERGGSTRAGTDWGMG